MRVAGIQSDVELHRGPGRRRSLRASGQKHGSRRADDYADTYGDDEAEEAEPLTGRAWLLGCLETITSASSSSGIVAP